MAGAYPAAHASGATRLSECQGDHIPRDGPCPDDEPAKAEDHSRAPSGQRHEQGGRLHYLAGEQCPRTSESFNKSCRDTSSEEGTYTHRRQVAPAQVGLTPTVRTMNMTISESMPDIPRLTMEEKMTSGRR